MASVYNLTTRDVRVKRTDGATLIVPSTNSIWISKTAVPSGDPLAMVNGWCTEIELRFTGENNRLKPGDIVIVDPIVGCRLIAFDMESRTKFFGCENLTIVGISPDNTESFEWLCKT